MSIKGNNQLAKRNVAVLICAQAILGSQMPMIFTVGGLAGQSLASNACFATLPISMIVLGSMLTASPLSNLMQKFGRKFGFFIGAIGGLTGGIIGAVGLATGSFAIFLMGSFLTGIYMSAQGFYRFAATDTATKSFRPKAISYVMAGGLASAIIGPQIVKVTAEAMVIPFLGTYIAVVILNFLGSFLFLLLKIPKLAKKNIYDPNKRSNKQLVSTPRIAVAMICAMVSYAMMNLVMTSTPLAVVGCGYSPSDAANVVSAHVIAMFLPSFFTGHLITRYGEELIVGIGLFFLALAGIVALSGVNLENFFLALVFIGLGWNFGFIGATTMLTNSHSEAERGRIQGMNDLFVFGGVTVASFSSGGLMNCTGGNHLTGWTSVNLAIFPMLLIAAATLVWLMKNKTPNYINS
ncbi:MAG: MFS transporter [Rhodobacteraceae bacterium]|jgi:MFS family permease|nr:MAG: MFS transporter [Paracoccaceae bacterium]|tara:strand:+ start:5680 stop:6900 length:1221 start_codon:yes stop_codon:yes gene_type:complete